MASTTTFGVEIEFLCIWPLEGSEARLYRSEYGRHLLSLRPQQPLDFLDAREVIYLALKAAGVPVTGCEAEDEIEPPRYTCWDVGVDANELTDEEYAARPIDCHDESIELGSRVFDLEKDNWQHEIKIVLDTLRKVERLGCRMITNDTSGLHVHVGAGVKRKVPLRVAKNVCQLATAFERVIDKMHSYNRVQDPENFIDDFYHSPLSFWHRNSTHHRDGDMLYDWLARIEHTQSHAELGYMFVLPPAIYHNLDEFMQPPNTTTYGHHCAYNFENLYADDTGRYRIEGSLKNTIEFRGHAGTLDFISILAWIRFVTSLVRYCSTVRPAEFLRLCAHGIDPNFELRDFLSVIRCESDVVGHYEHGNMPTHEDDGEVIGFLGDGQPIDHYATLKFDRLVEENDAMQSVFQDAQEKALVAKEKDYGYDAHAGRVTMLHFPTAAFERYYREARVQIFSVVRNGVVLEEEIDRAARIMVLRHLAGIYKGEIVDEKFADSGPVIAISRQNQCLPGP